MFRDFRVQMMRRGYDDDVHGRIIEEVPLIQIASTAKASREIFQCRGLRPRGGDQVRIRQCLERARVFLPKGPGADNPYPKHHDSLFRQASSAAPRRFARVPNRAAMIGVLLDGPCARASATLRTSDR